MRPRHPRSHVIPWYCAHVTNKRRYISTFTRPMNPKLGRVVTYAEGTQPARSRDTAPRGHVRNQSCYIPTFTKHMFPKLSRVVTLDESTPTHKVTWHIDQVVTWQIRNILSLLSQGAGPGNLSRMVTRMRRPHPACHAKPRSRRRVTTIQ